MIYVALTVLFILAICQMVINHRLIKKVKKLEAKNSEMQCFKENIINMTVGITDYIHFNNGFNQNNASLSARINGCEAKIAGHNNAFIIQESALALATAILDHLKLEKHILPSQPEKVVLKPKKR